MRSSAALSLVPRSRRQYAALRALVARGRADEEVPLIAHRVEDDDAVRDVPSRSGTPCESAGDRDSSLTPRARAGPRPRLRAAAPPALGMGDRARGLVHPPRVVQERSASASGSCVAGSDRARVRIGMASRRTRRPRRHATAARIRETRSADRRPSPAARTLEAVRGVVEDGPSELAHRHERAHVTTSRDSRRSCRAR